jgi:carbon-monoxide dehydrogenase large subunit
MTPPTSESTMPWIGRALRRLEDPALVTGNGRFTADLPAGHRVRFVRSQVAAGRIRSINGPPDACIITAADLGEVKPIRPILHKFNYRPIAQPVLAKHVVRFVGECIAAAIAPTDEEAEDIVDAIQVDIEPGTPVVDMHDALRAAGEPIHGEAPDNVVVEGHFKTPVFDATSASVHRIVGLRARSHWQSATPLEPRAAHAVYDRSTGRLTLTYTTQAPHLVRTALADLLGMPEADLRVVAPDIGGSFGQKMSLAPECVVVVWLAWKFRSSFSWVEDRRENLMAGLHSREQQVDLEGAFDERGKLLALSADVITNVGAYSCFPTTCAVEPLMALAEMTGAYDVKDYTCRARGVTSNTCTMGPYRGVARPVITFALEGLMDKAARELQIDPAEIRRRNLINQFPYTTATGLVHDEASHHATLELALEHIDLETFRRRQGEARAVGRYVGLGIATFAERTGYGSLAFAARGMEITPGWECTELSINPSGIIEARIGASPHGQGLRTTLAQIIADELGVSPENIRIVHGDTDRTPYGWGTFASRSLVISGGATLIAAQKVRAKLAKIAAHIFEVSPADIVLRCGQAVVAGTDRGLPIAALAREAYQQTHRFAGQIEPGISEKGFYDPLGTFSNACHAAVVEVDVSTGKVIVERFIVAEDAGRIINPMIVDGQVHGGVAQGIGTALLEEILYDETGNILSTSLADYRVPTVLDLPVIEAYHIETHTEATNLRSKGLGEGGAIGAPAAIMNAINDALGPFAVSIHEMPATPERIFAALRSTADPRPGTTDSAVNDIHPILSRVGAALGSRT